MFTNAAAGVTGENVDSLRVQTEITEAMFQSES